MVSSVQNNWRFLSGASSSGAFNMALDDQIARENSKSSVLRFYSWDPYAVSIGYHQSLNILNKNRCFENGVDIVRRPTGGRAIFHSEELTYSVVLRDEGIALNEAYVKIHSAIADGLSKIGVHSELVKTTPNRRELSPKSDKTSCFTASARTELEYNKRKIVGSAGKKYGNSLLIHGSILLGNKHKEIIEYLNLDNSQKQTMKDELDAKTDNISDILGRRVDPKELINPLKDSFSKEFQITFSDAYNYEETFTKANKWKGEFEILELMEKEVA